MPGVDATSATSLLASWQKPRLVGGDGPGPGVAAGIAHEIGLDPLFVRVSFVILGLAGGFGVPIYLVAWLWMRTAPVDEYEPIPKAATPARRVLGFVAVVTGILMFATQVSEMAPVGLVWPSSLVGLAFAVMWARLDPRHVGRASTGSENFGPRVLLGLVTMLAGVAVALLISLSFWQAISGIIVAALVVLGVSVLFAPVLGRMGSDLFDERRLRIRSEEKAEMAAHLHDSVLQTLTLIQKRSADPEVVGLARRQERELRTWLFEDQAINPNLGFRSSLERELGEVEGIQGVAIELVVVGDTPVDPDVNALIKAAREAATNAAKHSKSDRIDVFAEVGRTELTCFVRDHGAGFDPRDVKSDRAGIRDSIYSRIERHGGTAAIHSEIGRGTEVELSVPRRAHAGYEGASGPTLEPSTHALASTTSDPSASPRLEGPAYERT